ncbi:MAG: TIGR02281 family clan AA aspartic protease [Methylotenera sp.]
MFKIKVWLVSILGFAASLLALQALADTRVNVVGLFSNKAMVAINGGAPRTLSVGQTVDGVKLISADSESATFMVEGKRQTLKMGQAASVAGNAGPANNDPVSLYADKVGHFYGNLTINGASLKYVVDTGATTVALNSGDAKFAKIDYEKGERIEMSTANGVVNAYLVKLNTLKIGTITLNNVEATVNEGGSPPVVLLGMSALNRLDMKRDNSIMTLTKKY